MLIAHHISKSYNLKTILSNISFSLNPADHIGLIGPNGCGKTTLLRILTGLETPDAGWVTRDPVNLRIGYLAQGFEPDPHLTIAEILHNNIGNPGEAEAELTRLATELAADPDRRDLQAAYDSILEDFRSSDREKRIARSAQILAALGLSGMPQEQTVGILSGGQKTRLSLGLILLDEPQLLLLDEPTNHLDIQMLEWLESWLTAYAGAALIVSHDRTFLDRTVNRILDLNPETHTLREYAGNYTSYLDQYLDERDRQESAFRDQVYEIRKMRQDIARTKQQALRVEQTTSSRQPGVRRYAKKVARKAISREKKLRRYIDSEERVERPRQSWQMKLEFENPAHQSQVVLAVENLAIGYPGFPLLMSDLNLIVQSGQRIALTGPNGAGKTTLLRTIAGRIEPIGGRIRLGPNMRLGFLAQEGELVDPALSAYETIQRVAPMNETEARSFLHFFLFSGDDALRPAQELSFGERTRLALATLVSQGCNFLLLDEPINHLDIPSRTRFEQALAQFDGAVLAVVHDRYFINRFATVLWYLDQDGLRSKYFPGSESML